MKKPYPIHFPFGKKKKKKYLKATSPKWDNDLKWDNNSLTFEPTKKTMDQINTNLSHLPES